MADKGFLIQDPIDPLGVTLNIPPKTRLEYATVKKRGGANKENCCNKNYIKRKMEQIKNFRILQGVIPATEWHDANNFVLICAALSSLEPPLVT